jgi:hypothetical protein
MKSGGGSRMGYFMGYIHKYIYIYHQRDAGLVCLKMEKTHLELYYREVPLGTWLKGDLTPKFRWGCNGM